MTILFLILIILASAILGFIILVQNPKGGGLAGNVGGVGNQLMGVKQTTDVLEKGTWLFASIIGILCVVSSMFMGTNTNTNNSLLEKVNTSGAPVQTTPAQQQPTQPQPAQQQPASTPNK
jgi:preprotein translocase subunit SecG